MRLICFDLESGGGSLDFSVLTGNFKIFSHDSDLNFKIEDSLSLVIKHDIYKVHPEGMKVNQLDLNWVDANGVSTSKAGELLINFLRKNDAMKNKLHPMGHGIRGDIDQINSQILNKNNWGNFVLHNYIDTGVLALALVGNGILPEDQGLSLEALCNYFNLSGFKYHTAEGDCDANIALYLELQKLIKKNGGIKTP